MKKALLKLIPLFSALLCTALILASCADTDLAVTVTENGGTVSYSYSVDKEIADGHFGTELPDGIKACEIDEIDGRICYVFSESFTAQSFDELEDKLCNITLYGEDGMNVFSSASANSTSLRLTVNPCVTEDIKDIALIQGADLTELTKLTLTVTMPYEIEQYYEGTLSEDKKTLTLELSTFDAEKNVELKCAEETTETKSPPVTVQPKEPSMLPWILGGVFITLTVIGATVSLSVFLVTRRKRRRAEAMPETPIDKF